MTSEREEFAAAAEALVGTPFRFRGRDRKTGLDCVGVVLAALADIGRKPAELNGYAMRQTHPDQHIDVALACGFELFEGTELEPGDLLLVSGPIELVDHEGRAITVDGDKIALCRCGQSSRKPFCDATHRSCGFDGTCAADVYA